MPAARLVLAVRAVVFAAALFLGLLASFAVDRVRSQDRVLRGVMLGEVVLAGRDRADLERAVREFAERWDERQIVVIVSGKQFSSVAHETGLAVDQAALSSDAFDAGRKKSVVAQFGWWFGRLFTRHELPVPVELHRGAFTRKIEDWERRGIDEPPFRGAVVYRGRAVAEYPKPGYRIDRAAAGARLRAHFADGSDSVELPLEHVEPPVSRGAVDEALEKARRFLSGPIVLETEDGEHRLDLSVEELGRALDNRVVDGRLEVGFAKVPILRKIDAIRPEVEEPAREATFEVDASHRIRIVPSRVGIRIDDDAVIRLLHQAARGSKNRRVVLPLTRGDAPDLSTEQAEALGIKGLVSKFVTYHACCQARVKNIHRMADLIDGTVLRPGETFSLNEAVGPRVKANGFVMAPTIVEGEMEKTVGGGVSQFTTTLFNAVLDGGYEIVQRQPHSYYFPRYPMGHEATLSYPKPDLIFKNDTQAGMLIKTQYGKKHIRILIYGDNEGRKVRRKVSPRFDITDPPIEYEPNEQLLPGAAVLKRKGAIGWSVIVSRIITFPDGRTTEQRRKVVYNPRPRRVEVHPCKIPEGEKGHTGEDCPEPPDAGAPDGGLGAAR